MTYLANLTVLGVSFSKSLWFFDPDPWKRYSLRVTLVSTHYNILYSLIIEALNRLNLWSRLKESGTAVLTIIEITILGDYTLHSDNLPLFDGQSEFSSLLVCVIHFRKFFKSLNRLISPLPFQIREVFLLFKKDDMTSKKLKFERHVDQFI